MATPSTSLQAWQQRFLDSMDIPSPSARPGTPSVIFNAKIAPLASYAMRGALWYQGEANASGGTEYRTLLPRLFINGRGCARPSR